MSDFSSARQISSFPVRAMTLQCGVLWYRAPEVLLGSKLYNQSVDIWAMGLVFVEMLLKSPLFRPDGRTREIDMIFQVFRMMGTPDDMVWPHAKDLPAFRSDENLPARLPCFLLALTTFLQIRFSQLAAKKRCESTKTGVPNWFAPHPHLHSLRCHMHSFWN